MNVNPLDYESAEEMLSKTGLTPEQCLLIINEAIQQRLKPQEN